MLIEGLLRHKTYTVLAQQMGVSPLTMQDNVTYLRRVYQAQDRYELEFKLARLYGEQ